MLRALIVRFGLPVLICLKKKFFCAAQPVRKLRKCRRMLIRKSDFNWSEKLELKVLQTGTFKSALAT